MQKGKWILGFVLFSFYQITYSQTQDSVRIEKLFTDLLRGQADSSEVYMEVAEISGRLNEGQKINWIRYNEAKYLLFSGHPEKAEQIAFSALQSFKENENTLSSLKFYALLASSLSLQQQYEEAIRYFKKALEIAEENKMDLQAAYIHNNIANVFFSLLDYAAAHTHAAKSVEILRNYPDDPNYPSILAVLSVSEAKLDQFEMAEEHALQAREMAGKSSNFMALIIAVHALGEVEFSKNDFQEAQRYYEESLALAERFNQKQFVLLNAIGILTVSLEQKNYEAGVNFGEKALELAAITENRSTLYSIKRKLAHAYSGLGQYEDAFRMMNEAHEIYKETNKSETQKAINDLLIQYDTEKKEKEITRTRLELLAKEVESARLWNIITVTGILFLVLMIVFMIYRSVMKERIMRIESKKEKDMFDALIRGEERERRRLGHELHDGLASQLVGIKYRLESDNSVSPNIKQELLNQISGAHEETRRIAHNLAPSGMKELGLIESLRRFAMDNSTPHLSIEFDHIGSGTIMLSAEKTLMLFRIIQELVQNAVKHAKSDELFIQTSLTDKLLDIRVENNGVGFDVKKAKKGNGLTSIEERVHLLNGTFSIDSGEETNGAIAHISIYLNN